MVDLKTFDEETLYGIYFEKGGIFTGKKKKKASKVREAPKKPVTVQLMIDGRKFANLVQQATCDTSQA